MTTRPDQFAERGWQAEWKYNRRSFVLISAVTLGEVAGLAAGLLLLKKSNR